MEPDAITIELTPGEASALALAADYMRERAEVSSALNSGREKLLGVAWSTTARKWEAYCTVKRKKRLLGFFEDEDAAGEAARIFRRRHLPNSQD